MIFRASGKKPKVEVSVHKATAEELAEHRSFTERSERLRGMRAELMQKYPDKRVALTENGVFLVADSAEEMVAKILELGERPGYAARGISQYKAAAPDDSMIDGIWSTTWIPAFAGMTVWEGRSAQRGAAFPLGR